MQIFNQDALRFEAGVDLFGVSVEFEQNKIGVARAGAHAGLVCEAFKYDFALFKDAVGLLLHDVMVFKIKRRAALGQAVDVIG